MAFEAHNRATGSGVEMGGALKNVLAIACGISDGLGFGNNARAALITRGLVEITRLAVASGAHPMTMGGLAGMGDLVLTCTGILHNPAYTHGCQASWRWLGLSMQCLKMGLAQNSVN